VYGVTGGRRRKMPSRSSEEGEEVGILSKCGRTQSHYVGA
jgi:hypothetical protein